MEGVPDSSVKSVLDFCAGVRRFEPVGPTLRVLIITKTKELLYFILLSSPQ